MSDSAILAKPSIEEPSNHLPCSIAAGNWAIGIVTLLTIPTTSEK